MAYPIAEIADPVRIDGTGEAHPQGSYVLLRVRVKDDDPMRGGPFRISIGEAEQLIAGLKAAIAAR